MNTFYFSQYRSLHENWPNTEYFLVRIFLYSVWIKENTDQKRLRIWTLFMQLVIQQRDSFFIPLWHSREFVLHCLERRKIALGSDLSGITCQGKDLFTVLSFTNSLSECYEVYFGNEDEMAKYSCYDWGKTGCLYNIFLKNVHYVHSMHYNRCILTVLF